MEEASVGDVAKRIVELIKGDDLLKAQPLHRIMLALLLVASTIVDVLKEDNIDLSEDFIDIVRTMLRADDPLADMMVG